jgi:hypothetical protein
LEPPQLRRDQPGGIREDAGREPLTSLRCREGTEGEQGKEQGNVGEKSECALLVQFGNTSAIQGATNVPPELIGRCGVLPNSAQYTRTDNAENGLNAKTYQLTSGVLVVGHLTDDALGVAVFLSLERVTISPDEMPEKIQIEGSVIACARTPDANDGGICPGL